MTTPQDARQDGSRTELEELIRAAVLNLTANQSMKARHNRFLDLFSTATGNHACALLRYQDGALVPVATRGLSPQVMGRNFRPEEHPRLTRIIESRQPVRFAANDPRPDPYDGLALGDDSARLPVHACMGCALWNESTLFGVLTADAWQSGMFDGVDDSVLQVFAAIATVALRYETYINTLETLAEHRGQVAAELVSEALERSHPILGDSASMQALNREIELVARSDLTVLLMGETGVGKEVLTRVIHSRSPRADQPLVYVNCAALPEALAESELFGHVRGAFTGAGQDRAGKFQRGRGGSPVSPGLPDRGRHRPRSAADPASGAEAIRAPRSVAGRGGGVDARLGAPRRFFPARRSVGSRLGPGRPGTAAPLLCSTHLCR